QLGRLRRLGLGWWRHRGVPAPGSWRTQAAISPGGVLEDLGPHLLDIAAGIVTAARLPLAEPAAVVRSRLERRGGAADGGASWFGGEHATYDAPDHCAAELRLSSGCTLALEIAWTDPRPDDEVRIHVEGDDGQATLTGLLGFSTARRQREQTCA